MTGQNGGAAFILVYLACILLLGIPCMVSEFIIGRHGASNTARAYTKLSGGSPWKWVGYMGVLGFSLPTSNEYINGQPGDVVLYGGSNICIFYGSNSYSYTRLGKISGLSADELKAFLKGGQSNISVTLSLPVSSVSAHHVNDSKEKDVLYSLNGQRVDSPSRGIYIKKGKKVVL